MLAEGPAIDGYWISFAMTGNTDRLFTLAERVACAENHDVFLSGTVWNAKTRIAAFAQPADVVIWSTQAWANAKRIVDTYSLFYILAEVPGRVAGCKGIIRCMTEGR